MQAKRTLIYIPVLHSPQDMGSLATALAPSEDYRVQVAEYWERVGAELHGMRQSWEGVRVFQDGLPAAREDIVARIVADVDSPNYELLRWLASQGAELVGTEDPVLLQEEYELLKASMTDESARRSYAARADGLLSERDRYIAARIEHLVPDGGTGLLFVGLQHKATEMLPGDFTVRTLRCCREILPAITSRLAAGRQRGAGDSAG